MEWVDEGKNLNLTAIEKKKKNDNKERKNSDSAGLTLFKFW